MSFAEATDQVFKLKYCTRESAMPGAPPPPASAAPLKSQELVKGAAPDGPAPSGLPPGLLQRVSERVKRISREEVAGNDESFVNEKDESLVRDNDDSPLKVELGDSDNERDLGNEGASDYATNTRYAGSHGRAYDSDEEDIGDDNNEGQP